MGDGCPIVGSHGAEAPPCAGMEIVCDGTPAAARRLARVLTNDPASGDMRHADAGCACARAREHQLDLPMLE